mmetsp:Transcript_48034/g.114340  ORF Transcript_48034/g.114340 Transcript_48034/m.114340 type:complete len:247 (-) Transcript_48034:6352-7092(-)
MFLISSARIATRRSWKSCEFGSEYDGQNAGLRRIVTAPFAGESRPCESTENIHGWMIRYRMLSTKTNSPTDPSGVPGPRSRSENHCCVGWLPPPGWNCSSRVTLSSASKSRTASTDDTGAAPLYECTAAIVFVFVFSDASITCSDIWPSSEVKFHCCRMPWPSHHGYRMLSTAVPHRGMSSRGNMSALEYPAQIVWQHCPKSLHSPGGLRFAMSHAGLQRHCGDSVRMHVARSVHPMMFGTLDFWR